MKRKTFVYVLVSILILGGIAGGLSVTQTYAGLPLLMPTPTVDAICSGDDSVDSQELVPPPHSPLVPLENIIGGTVVEVEETRIVISTADRGQVTLQIVPETRIWKGKWDSQLPIEVGDFLYGYGVPNEESTVFEMEQLEVNIVSLRGPVSSVTQTAAGVDIVLEESYTGVPTLVHIESDTLVTTDSGENAFEETPIEVEVGDGFQIIGLQLRDGSVLATRIF